MNCKKSISYVLNKKIISLILVYLQQQNYRSFRLHHMLQPKHTFIHLNYEYTVHEVYLQ